MLNLSVEPLDGSPALTSPVQFTPNAALGTPALSSSTGNGNYAATWLNSAIAGLTGTATVGTLTVTVPGQRPEQRRLRHSLRPCLGLAQRHRLIPQTDPHRPDPAVRPFQLHLSTTASPTPGGSVTSAR